jgi:hypothetical protein
LKQAAAYFRLTKAQLTKKRGQHRQERALVMELLHRYSGLKQRMIGERFGGLDEGLVSRDRRAIREKIETEPKIRKWVHLRIKSPLATDSESQVRSHPPVQTGINSTTAIVRTRSTRFARRSLRSPYLAAVRKCSSVRTEKGLKRPSYMGPLPDGCWDTILPQPARRADIDRAA